MELSGTIVMALVLGGLQIFFLRPSEKEGCIGFQENGKVSLIDALKESFVKITFHKKAFLAFLLLFFTLKHIWDYYVAVDWHNEAHGVISSIKPIIHARNYMIAALGYALIIYFAMIFRRAFKLLRKTG